MDASYVAAGRFKPSGKIMQVQKYGNGNVNDTYLVTLDSSSEDRFILQRINTRVFKQPALVMSNIRAVNDHSFKPPQRRFIESNRRFELPRVLLTRDGQDHWIDSDGSFWRALSFIRNARSYDIVSNEDHAQEVGFALGRFHGMISDLPVGRLADTLPGFHIAPLYLGHYDRIVAGRHPPRRPEIDRALRFVEERRDLAHVLEKAKTRGELFLRPIHGDPKVNNVMIDKDTGHAVSIVDLDTVKPGLIHYDIGDLLRSGCNPAGEETDRLETVHFEPDLCRAILRGYLGEAVEFLTVKDREYLYPAIRLIAFELGLRFLCDHLEGDVYFKVKHPGHNLVRALVQLKLTESIESKETEIRAIIRDMK